MRQKAKVHGFLFSSTNGTPWDMNVCLRRKMQTLLMSLGIPHAGYHAFRHFNVSLLDALRVPPKVIQERIALTGSFTLDVYGGQPEWDSRDGSRNVIELAIHWANDRPKTGRCGAPGPCQG